jgi:hypothetical protein
MSWGLAAPLAASFLLAARAEVVVLTPVADTTLVEAAPTNNLGGMPFVNAGTTQTFTRNRGLFRFASREDAGRAPLLRIEFDPPPRIEHALVVGSSLVLQFTARAGQVYVVESRDRFTAGTPWLELTNVPAPTVTTYVTVIDLGPPAERFYRLRLP